MIAFEINEGVGRLTLDRPPVNALDRTMIELLDSAIEQIRATDECAALIVQSNAKVFCAGADIDMLKGFIFGPNAEEDVFTLSTTMQAVFEKLESLPIPTIAAIEGAATGGGLELALACDLRIASETAVLGLPELKLGLVPAAGGTQRLVRVAGRSNATKAILMGDLYGGAAALQMGIVDWATPRDNVRTLAAGVALAMADKPRNGVEAVKACLRLAESSEGYRAESNAARRLIGDPSTRARVEAFLAKSSRVR